jgi:flagellar M-ring protein FliF
VGAGVNNLTRLLLQSGPARIIAALGLTAVLAAVVFGLVFHIGGEEKALLFSGVDMKDAGAITAKLDQAQIPYELRGDGSAIYVPRSKVLSARMMLSADGLPARGSVGYEIFDKPDALGQTQFMQNINRLRALEGELARSIASLDGVSSARVHLVLPERQLFERDREEPSASIVLKLTRDSLSDGEVRAIRNLVASATPGLSAQRVTILDETGALLAAAQNPDDPNAGEDGVDERQAAAENRIRKTVQDIVEGVVGPGNARVQVTADLDLNRVTQASETFDPEGRVVRSTQTVEETSKAQDGAQQGATSASANLPDSSGGASGASGSQNNSSRTEETVNYEISKTTKTEVIEGGTIKKLSVAVAVDGVSTPGAKDGDPPKWTARTPEEMAHLTALVKSAVGFDETRGDKVEVVNVRFARPPVAGAIAEKPSMFSFQSDDLMRGGEILAALVVGLAMVIFVLGPLARGLIGPAPAAAPDLLAAPAAPNAAALALPAAAPPPTATALPAPNIPEPEPLIDVARIHGQVKASSVKKVAEVVEQHPEESVSIIRGWLNNAV